MKKQNVKMSEMAKVITLKINMDGEDVYTIISAVSLDMTPEQMIDMRMFPDAKVSVEESNKMPLLFALDYAERQCKKNGINKMISFINNQAA